MTSKNPPTWSRKVEFYRWLYSLLLYTLMPLQMLRLWRKGRELPAYRQRWSERFGRLDSLPPLPVIWLHSVSVGETIAAAPLVERLISDYPDHRLLVTTTTPTGSDQVKRLFGSRVSHSYFPYDLPHVVKRFLDRSRPKILVLMETELWPNLLRECHLRGIPVVIVNARLSQKSLDGYLRVKALLDPMLATVRAVAAQTTADAERFVCLGAQPERVLVAGNIKSDVTLPQEVRVGGQRLREQFGSRPVWLAASTHRGEEEQVLDAHQQVLLSVPDALLVLVPRHPERFDEVASICEREVGKTVRRSRGEDVGGDVQVYLGDSMGELLQLYAAADIAFVGGSLVEVGGHNPLEPAALGLAIVTGPHVHNFQAVYENMLERDAAKMIGTGGELAEVVIDWMVNDDRRREVGEAALGLLDGGGDVTHRLASLITEQIDEAALAPAETP